MHNSNLSLPSIAAVALVIAAILGYVAGVEADGTAPHATTPALATSVLLEYPKSWRAASAAPQIPGLPILHSVVFAPGGNASESGLVSGKLELGEASPLPAAFLAGLPRPLDATVVNFAESQAYRYSLLGAPGFSAALTLYVLPGLGGGPTVLACYATAGDLAAIGPCERIVATLRVEGQPQSYNLTPVPAYASRITALIGRLEQQRVTLRAQMGDGVSAARVNAAAGTLAQDFSAAAGELSHLEPPLAAGQAQLALSDALTAAGNAYAAVARAAQGASGSAYRAALANVAATEGGVDNALDGFAALAYVRS